MRKQSAAGLILVRAFVFTSFLFTYLGTLFQEPVWAQVSRHDQIKIGVVIPLSGGLSSLGEQIRNGIELCYDSLPAAKRAGVRLFFEDDQSKPSQAAAAAQKLIAQEQVSALVVFGSGMGHVVAPIAERNKTLMIAVFASDPKVSAGRDYSFTHWVTPDLETRVLADEVQKRAYKALAILAMQQEGIQALQAATHRAFAERSMDHKIVLEQTYLPDNTNFRSFVASAKAKGVDGVITLLFPEAIAPFVKQANEMKLGASIIGFETFEDQAVIQAAAGGLEGQWYVNASASSDSFEKAFVEHFNRSPGLGSANAYDILDLLVTALEANNLDRTAAAKYLRTVQNYAGAAGTYSATGDNRFSLPAEVKVIRANRFEPLYR